MQGHKLIEIHCVTLFQLLFSWLLTSLSPYLLRTANNNNWLSIENVWFIMTIIEILQFWRVLHMTTVFFFNMQSQERESLYCCVQAVVMLNWWFHGNLIITTRQFCAVYVVFLFFWGGGGGESNLLILYASCLPMQILSTISFTTCNPHWMCWNNGNGSV